MEVTEFLENLNHACAVIRRDNLLENSADTPEVRAAYAAVEQQGEIVAKMINMLTSAGLAEVFGWNYRRLSAYVAGITPEGTDPQLTSAFNSMPES